MIVAALQVHHSTAVLLVSGAPLELLRHGRQHDFALVNRGEVERALSGTKHVRDFGCQEVL